MPIGLAIDGANRHDMKLVEATVESIPVPRPEPTKRTPQGMCLDKGYDYDSVRDLVPDDLPPILVPGVMRESVADSHPNPTPPPRQGPDAPQSLSCLREEDLNAPVHGAPRSGRVICNRPRPTLTPEAHPRGGDADIQEDVSDGFGACHQKHGNR